MSDASSERGRGVALDRERIAAALTTARYGRSLSVLTSTQSTNDDARLAAADGAAEGHVVVADSQRSGRGSHGRQWSSPQGQDLYVSIVDRPRVAFAELPPLTLAVGLGVADAVDALLARAARDTSPAPRCRVKWPNDVWLDGKKCAGILIEASASGSELDCVVIGIGLNVNRSEFPDTLTQDATSLRLASGHVFDRNQTLAELLLCVERWVDRFVQVGVHSVTQALSERLALLGEPVRCDGTTGILRGVSEAGALRIETPTGVRELIAGRLLRADALEPV